MSCSAARRLTKWFTLKVEEKMINLTFRLFLTFNATSLIIVVYLIKSHIVVNSFHPVFKDLPDYISYTGYLLIPILFTVLSLFFSSYLTEDSIEPSADSEPVIKEVEQANNSYLPSYLGYFFVALSIDYCDTLIFSYGILFVFTFLSQTLYFNPLFLIFGYHFYYITTSTNIKIFIITKRSLKSPNKLHFPKLKRINDFTFIENYKSI
jgi:hypothetical protein